MAKFVTTSSKIMSLIFVVVVYFLACKGVVASNPIGDMGVIYTPMRGNATKPSPAMFVTYQNNVRSLISALAYESSGSTSAIPSFYNTTFGDIPNKVYGTYLCRGDLSPQHCRDCVLKVSQNLQVQFSLSPDFYQDWYSLTDECMIHFANHSILGVYVKDDVFLPGPGGGSGVPNMKEINQTLSDAMGTNIDLAANSLSKFATDVVDVTGSNDHEKLYVLVQCTPDLSSGNCSACLKNLYSGFESCCGGNPVGVAVHASCMIKYSNQSFFDTSSAYPALTHGFLYVYFVLLFIMYYLS